MCESDDVLVGAELVSTDTTAWNDNAVEFLSGNFINRLIHLTAATYIEIDVVGLGFAGLDTVYVTNAPTGSTASFGCSNSDFSVPHGALRISIFLPLT